MSTSQTSLGAVLRTLVNGFEGNMPSANTTQDNNGGGELTMNDLNRIISALISPSPTARQTPVPIRVRLAVARANSHRAAPADGFPSYEASPAGKKLESYCQPLPSDSATSAADATIADLTQHIVEDLFINNKEAHFLNADRSKFLAMLLGSDRGRSLSDVIFTYGAKMTKIESGKSSGSKSTCIIAFSLMEETEGYHKEISPFINAYEILGELLSESSNRKKLDLTLKAHIMCPYEVNKVPLRKRKNPCKENERCNEELSTKRNKAGHAKETLPPDATTKHPNGIPPALSEAWENQKLAPILANDKEEADSETEMDVEQLPVSKNDSKCNDDKVVNVEGNAKRTKSDNTNVNAQSSTENVASSTRKVDSNEDMPAGVISLLSSDSDEKKEEEAAEAEASNSMVKSKGNSNPGEKLTSSFSRDEDEGSDEVGVYAGNKSRENADSSVPPSNARANASNVGSQGINKSTSQKEGVKNSSCAESEEDSSYESRSSSSSGSSSSGSSEESEDKDNKSPVPQGLTVAFTEPRKNERDTTASTQHTEKKKIDVPTLLASGKATPYDVTVASSDPTFTQESAMEPTVLFDESGDYNAATQHMRGLEIKSSTTPSINYAKKSEWASPAIESDGSSSSSSSSSCGSEESDEEGDDEKPNKEKPNIEQSANADEAEDDEKPMLYPLTQKSIHSASESSSSSRSVPSSSDEDEQDKSSSDKKVKELKAGGDKDGSSNSSSSSSGSSSGSSSSSSSLDTDSSSSDEEEKAKEVIKKPSASRSFMPVVHSSKGRRRSPLVPMSRKIVINTSSKAEKLSR